MKLKLNLSPTNLEKFYPFHILRLITAEQFGCTCIKVGTGIICHLSEKSFKFDPVACNCKSVKLCRSDAEMFDIVVKRVKASVRFLIAKSRPENVTHEKRLQSRPFSIYPHLFSRLSAIPNGILQLTSLTPHPTRTHAYTPRGAHLR